MSADPQTPPSSDSPRRPARGLALWVPALLAALIVAALWGPNLMRPPPPAWTVYANVKGQTRRVVLSDKSVMRLNGASQVRLVYEDERRRAALGQAEMALTIAPSPRRPFLIASGDRVIRIDDGEINVLRQTGQTQGRTVLTLRRGQARIYPDDNPARAVLAGPGHEVSWVDGQAAPPALRAVNAANAFAWENHQLAYDKAPLETVVADLNRYVARPIRIADPSLAALPFTGVLALEGEDVMLKKIGAVLPVESRAAGAEILLQRARPKPAVKAKPPRGRLVQSILKLNPPRPLPKARAPAARAPAKPSSPSPGAGPAGPGAP